MDASSLTNATFVVIDDLGNTVPGQIVYDDYTGWDLNQYHTLEFTPNAELLYGKRYTATIRNQATNVADIPLADNVSWSFTAAPAPAFQGPRQIISNLADVALTLALDRGGSIYIGGYTHGVLPFQQSPGVRTGTEVDSDPFFTKFDPSGRALWTTQIRTAGNNDRITDIALDTQRNIYVVGTQQSTTNRLEGFVWKYSPDGRTRLNSYTISSPDDDQVKAIAIDPVNHFVYVVGHSANMVSDTTRFSPSNLGGLEDIFLYKFDENLNVVVGHMIASIDVNPTVFQFNPTPRNYLRKDFVNDVAVDSTGQVHLVGSTTGVLGAIGTISSNLGAEDSFWISFRNSGSNNQFLTRAVARQFGGVGSDIATGIGFDANGDIYISGSTNGALGNIPAQGQNDLFAVKYNRAGTLQWMQKHGSSSYDHGNAIVVDPTGDNYICGVTGGALSAPQARGTSDGVVFKFDANGSFTLPGGRVWSRQTELSTATMDDLWAIGMDESGNIYVAGSTDGLLPGVIRLANAVSRDITLFKLDPNGNLMRFP